MLAPVSISILVHLFLTCSLMELVFSRQIQFVNNCGNTIWVAQQTNNQGLALPGGIAEIGGGGSSTYNIPDGGWSGRFWPKSGCDSNGQSCEVGQSIPPCGPRGCDPPAETKVEFHFPPIGGGNTWYDISLVDGYSLSAEIVPSVNQGSCVTTNCEVQLNDCPTNENDVGDLRVMRNGRTVMCLSPCKKWNYPSPFGLGRSERDEPGAHLCCPTPPIYPKDCQSGIVTRTNYVNLIHRVCPTAYSYAYDDQMGLHNCPNDVSFKITFCQ